MPVEYGGQGLGLDDFVRLQSRLGYYAAPTALGVNMHIYWTGVAADLAKSGDQSCDFINERAAAGDIFAALHGEPGNDIPLLLSSTSAERVPGGWKINGHKIFGSLSPVWTLGGFHAMDTTDPSGPQIVHGFVDKNADGLEIVDTWDTFGMRATQSQDTVLHDVFVPDEQIALVCPAGMAGAGMFQRRRVRLGADGLRRRVPGHRPPCVRHHRQPGAAAVVGRADPVHGVPPRGPAPGGRHADGARRDRRHASSAPPPTGPPVWPTRTGRYVSCPPASS